MSKIRGFYQNVPNSDIYMKDLNLAKVIMDLVSKYISPVAGTSWKYAKRPSEPKSSSSCKKPTSLS
jgi:hypothetical protein